MIEAAPQLEFRMIALELVDRNPKQPRTDFESPAAKQDLQELADSIREYGVQTPLRVRAKPDGRYELIAGERRTRAARLAGKSEAPALVGDVEDRQLLRLALVENIQRRDLSPIEEAVAYQGLREEESGDLNAVVKATGKAKTHIEGRIALLALPPTVQQAVHHGQLTLGCAEVLLELDNPADILKYAEIAIKQGLSPAKLRARIQHLPRKKRGDGVERSRKKVTAKALSKTFIECYNLTSDADVSALPEKERATLLGQAEVLSDQLQTFRRELETAGAAPAESDPAGEAGQGEEGRSEEEAD